MNTQRLPFATSSSEVAEPNNEESHVLSYLTTHDAITRTQTEALLDVSSSTASRILKSMMASHLIEQQGKGRATAYILKK